MTKKRTEPTIDVPETAREGVRIVLQEIVDSQGRVEARDLLEAARPKSSPAHAGFEWSDRRAGEAYRLEQARRWVRIVPVETPEGEASLVHVPYGADEESAYERAEGARGPRSGYYVPVTTLASSCGDEFERALSSALSRVIGATHLLSPFVEAAQRSPRRRRSKLVKEAMKHLGIAEDALREAS